MSQYSFQIKNSKDKFESLVKEYEEFLVESDSSTKAISLSTNAWHLVDWVHEDKSIHNRKNISELRESFYLKCPSLLILHDLVNGSKHHSLSRPKGKIRETRIHEGTIDNSFDFSFDTTHLKIELEDSTILVFDDEISKVLDFWKDYFNKLPSGL